ncbi:MAG: TlpA family protein disulfide reductase [Rhodanobacter sp.]|jgi:thiol-disulfide isomerase/thioredoxin|nr:TlpA family protein disulfide reductase [Rhodanobacter sp.]
MNFLRAVLLSAAVVCAGLVHAAAKQPVLKVATLDGGSFDLAAARGHWVIVNFWATWCSPCIKEMPDISAFVAAHPEVRAIGLAFEDTDKAEVQAFVKAHPVKYPIAQIDIYAPPADFDTPRGLPLTYLIAPDGSIAKTFTGPIMATDLKKAIAGK